MKLSIVMPVYNEEATLREIVARVLATPYEKELLLVDDCSRDSSPEIIALLVAEHPEVRSFRHETNLGKGAALRTGFQNVEGDVVVIPAGENHWHGAPDATSMAHITITVKGSQTEQTEA